MNRKLITLAIASLMAFGSTAAISVADPGPNGKNNKGLCTAYFNGQKKGHEKNGNPGPFAGLEAAAEEAEMSIYDYCMQYGIGGNPGENGRFTECFDEDENTGNDACPSEDE